MKIYVNGILENSMQIASTTIKASTKKLLIRANPEKNDKYSNLSAIDVYQTVLYNRALSDEEIKANMSDTIKVTNSEELLSYVDFANKKDYEDNEVIPEDIIESYFVWIPKYRYKLWDLGNYDSFTGLDTTKVHTIDILFGDYMTHPSFLSIPSTGFWVGKFETGYKGEQSVTAALSNTYDVSKIEIKPNVYSWQNIDLAYAHLNAYNYKRSLGGYTGQSDSCNTYCNDGTCNSPYNTSSSTAGTIYGVYDMSGSAWEYVMAVMISEDDNFVSGKDSTLNSNFNGLLSCRTCTNNNLTEVENAITSPLIQYHDTYSYVLNNSYQFKNRILGDATGEFGPFESYGGVNNGLSSWYKNSVAFVNSENPWFIRGGDNENGTLSGIFTFSRIDGSGGNRRSFRILLTPLK